jgi:hypothetical protein
LLLLFFAGRSPAQSPALSSKPPVESEVSVIYGGSVGSVRLFSYASDRRVDLLAVQYARHSWGGLLTARVDYFAEVMPMVLLHEPRVYGADSIALTRERKTVYGGEVMPIGVRTMWLRDRRFKPYLIGAGGVMYFKDRVLSTEGSHLNFNAEFGGGVKFNVRGSSEVRLGYSFYHISNGDTARRNPGLDNNLIYAAWCFDLPGRRKSAQ